MSSKPKIDLIMKIKALTLAFTFLIGTIAFAGNEGETDKKSNNAESTNMTMVKGQVLDLTSGESIAGAEVSIENSQKKTYTDFDGNFKFENLSPGNYNIVISYISYDKSLLEDVKIKQGKTEQISVKLVNSK